MRIGFLIILALVLSYITTRSILRHAQTLGLMAYPNHRSSHQKITPQGGGGGVVLSTSLVGLLVVIFFSWDFGFWLLGLGFMIAVVGFRDDTHHVAAYWRFMIQLALAMILLAILGHMPALSLWGNWQLTGVLLSIALLFAAVWWINLFNFMDGIDGLAAAQALFMLLAIAGLLLWQHGWLWHKPEWFFLLILASAIMGFLWLNWPPAKIFMGDVGSTYVAFVVFAITLYVIKQAYISYGTVLILAAVFVTDATVTLLRRMCTGERWYEAHRTHAYQKLSQSWQSHKAVTLFVASINIFWLLPLAAMTIIWPYLTYIFLIIAYLPLVCCCLWVIKAGTVNDKN